MFTLSGGRFFGAECRQVETPSFAFAELNATVPEREVPRHTHEGPHFVLVTRGIYVTEARGQDGLCPPGTLIFNPGGTTHRDRFRSADGRFLSITPKVLDCRGAGPVVLHNPLARLAPLRALAGLLMRGDVDYESLGLELVGAAFGTEDCGRLIPAWLSRARELLDDGVDAPVSEIARVAGVHAVSLARGFRKHFGCSPGEYRRRVRLGRLRDLLSSRIGLAEAALACGFSDQSQMTRAFQRTFGIPPGRFRRLSRAF